MAKLWFLCALCLSISLPKGTAEKVEEGESVDLEYKTLITSGISRRSWYRGSYTDQPADSDRLFVMADGKTWTKVTERPDMSANPTTFSMTIGETKLGDSDFTCVTEYDIIKKEYKQADKVEVYVQPEVTITTTGTSVANEPLTVTCTVDRLYPGIPEGNFVMTWPGRVITDKPTSEDNGDQTKRYTISTTQKLSTEDNGKTVTCKVTPKSGFGEERSNTTTLDVISPTSACAGLCIGLIIAGLVVAAACTVAGLLVCSHKGTCCWSRDDCPSCSNCHSGGCCSSAKFRCPCC